MPNRLQLDYDKEDSAPSFATHAVRYRQPVPSNTSIQRSAPQPTTKRIYTSRVPAVADIFGRVGRSTLRNSAIRCGLIGLRSKLRCVYIDRAESREDVADGV